MKNSICLAAGLILATQTAAASAAIINFSFTGRLTVFHTGGATDPYDINQFSIITGSDTTLDPYGYQTPIAANLSVDTSAGSGFSDLSFNFSFMGQPVSIHDITLDFQGNNMIAGQMLADWSGTVDNPISILWDGSGLFNAIDTGLKAGDRISGTNLYRDTDGDGTAETFVADVGSATPWSDNWMDPTYAYPLNQGAAPIATTPGLFGITDGPFAGVQVHLDIGSGNSLYVESIQTSAVPVPAAAWLFGGGLLSLVGLGTRRRS